MRNTIYTILLLMLTISCQTRKNFNQVSLYNYDDNYDKYEFIVSNRITGKIVINGDNLKIYETSKTKKLLYEIRVEGLGGFSVVVDNKKHNFKCYEGLTNSGLVKLCECDKLKIAFLYMDLKDSIYQTSYILNLK